MSTTTVATPVAKKIEEQRFEFVLYINKHIVCQRYFNIRDYNEKSPRSLEIKDLMDRLVGMNNVGGLGLIPNRLKNKSVEYLWKNYNPYYQQKPEIGKNIFDKLDTFDFEIKVDKVIVAQSTFSGNFFPPQVRYQVDIKEIIPDIISEIKDVLSAKKYTTKFADVVL
jgi:hypothetical protein